jgi:transcriptional regulator with XRE-family HTH domain
MTSTESRPRHLGNNVRKIRELKGLKQGALADMIGEKQQYISTLEHHEHIDDAKLQRIADALNITVNAIKEFNDDAAINNIGNNFHDNSVLQNLQYHSYPMEKVVELYEQLLDAEREKVKLYQEMIALLKASSK